LANVYKRIYLNISFGIVINTSIMSCSGDSDDEDYFTCKLTL